MKDKSKKILWNILFMALLMSLIYAIKDDILLTIVYVIIILLSFHFKHDKKDFYFFAFGFVAMFFSEYFFIKSGSEVFYRNSLFGIMPLWLPLLWGYAFILMRRVIILMDKK